MIQSKKTQLLIAKYKPQVLKRYPDAFARKVHNGYTIIQEQDDVDVDLLYEYLVQPANDEASAWKQVYTLSRITQNINRTHPFRSEGMIFEDKISGASDRQHKIIATKQSQSDKQHTKKCGKK